MTADVQRELAEALGQLAMRGGYGLGVLASEHLAADLLPTVQRLIADAEKRAAAVALEPVRTMHVAGESGFCSGCGWTFPCPTIAALDPAGAASGETT